jgi:hypothetical protein
MEDVNKEFDELFDLIDKKKSDNVIRRKNVYGVMDNGVNEKEVIGLKKNKEKKEKLYEFKLRKYEEM